MNFSFCTYSFWFYTKLRFYWHLSPANTQNCFEWNEFFFPWFLLILLLNENLKNFVPCSLCIHLFEIRMFEIHQNISILRWSTLGWIKKFLEKNFYCSHQRLPIVSPCLFQMLHIYNWDPLEYPVPSTNWHLPWALGMGTCHGHLAWALAIGLYKGWIQCCCSWCFSTLLKRSSG